MLPLLRLFLRKGKLTPLRPLVWDVALSPLFPFPLSPLYALWIVAEEKLGATPSSLKLLFTPRPLLHSFWRERPLVLQTLLSLLFALTLSFFYTPPLFLSLLLFPLLIPSSKKIQKNPSYPLLRSTHPPSPSPPDKPHIIFLFLESFRSADLGTHSPHFNALARDGLFFPNCYATGPQTFFAALASLFGVQPSRNTHSLFPYTSIPLISLPSLLKKIGYETGSIDGSFAQFNGTRPFFEAHEFDEVLGAEELRKKAPPPLSICWGVHDEVVYSFATQWLKKKKKPTFLTLFTASNHHPWNPPPGIAEEKDPLKRFLATFRYTDACLGKFIEELEREGLLDQTLLFITADHGQEMKEGNFASRISSSEAAIQVPLLLYAPKRISPGVHLTPCSHIDLFSTVVDLLSLSSPHHSMGENLLQRSEKPVFFSFPSLSPQWGCRRGKYKWVSSPSGEKGRLYDLESDPKEEHNLISQLPDIAQELFRLTAERFSLAESLFEERRWAPPQSERGDPLLLDLTSSPHLRDEELSSHLTPFLTSICLPSSPFLTDASLEKIARELPALRLFEMGECPLVTEAGVEAILRECRSLEYLFLANNFHFERLSLEERRPSLLTLSLGEHVALSGLQELLPKFPHLTHLDLSLRQATAADLEEGLLSLTHLVRLTLWDGAELSDELLEKLLRENHHLLYLKITSAPRITRCELLHWTTHLELVDCPLLERIGRGGEPLRRLTLHGCPRMRGDVREELNEAISPELRMPEGDLGKASLPTH